MPVGTPDAFAAATDVCRASREVERARDATHKAVAESRAASGGESESTIGCQEMEHVPSGVLSKACQEPFSTCKLHATTLRGV